MDICEKILDKKDINYYYFIFLNNNEVGIFVSYFEFDKILSFLEDERVPSSSKSLNKSIKELEEMSVGLIVDPFTRKKKEVLSVRESYVIFENFEDTPKFKVLLQLFFFFLIIPIIPALLAQLIIIFNGTIIFQVSEMFFVAFLGISMFLFVFLLFTPQMKKWRIENFKDRIVINTKKEILHSDIKKVYLNSFKISRRTKRFLVIEYVENQKIREISFDLKYTKYASANKFLELFRY